jgi:hypothetical protein
MNFLKIKQKEEIFKIQDEILILGKSLEIPQYIPIKYIS